MRKSGISWWAVLVLALALASPGAAADVDLDAARQAGLVGEQVDGYVGLVKDSAPEDVRALVKDVNQRRRQHYRELAAKHGLEVTAVAASAGAKLVAKAPAGQWVKDARGRWVQK